MDIADVLERLEAALMKPASVLCLVLRVEDGMDCHCLALFKTFDEHLPSKCPTDPGPCVCVCACAWTCVFYTALQNDWDVQKDIAKWALCGAHVPLGCPSLRSLGGPSVLFDGNFCSFQIVLHLFSSFKQLSRAAILAFGCWSHRSVDFCYFLPLWWFSSVLLFSLASTFISTVCSPMVLSIHSRESSHSALWRRGHSLTSLLCLPQWVVHDLCLSSGNCGDPSLGSQFGARIRISVSRFHFYQPLLCLLILGWDAAVSAMAGIFISGCVFDHCKWWKVGHLISISWTFHR